MICIKISSGEKWHYLRNARTLCGVPGQETDRRDLGLATHGETICQNCDRELRRLGRATRRARDLRAASLRDAVVYHPLHREHFEMSVVHVDKPSLATIDPEEYGSPATERRFRHVDRSHTQRGPEWTSIR